MATGKRTAVLRRAALPPELKPDARWEHELLGPVIVDHVGATDEGRKFVQFHHAGRSGGGAMYVEHFLETAKPAESSPATG